MTLTLPHKLVFKALCSAAIAGTTFAGLAIGAKAQEKPEPDVLVLKNGDQLTGTLEKGTDNNITFKSVLAGEVTVALDNVKELHSHGNFAVIRKGIVVNHQTVHPGTLDYTGTTLQVTNAGGRNDSVNEKEIAFIVDEPTFNKQLATIGFFHGWTGAASGGATRVQATNYGSTFNVAVNLLRAIPVVSYLPPRNKTIVNVSETYGQLTSPTIPTPPAGSDIPTTSVVKTSIFHADAERDEYFSPRLYALADVSFDHNFSQGLDLQQVYGGGLGWTVFNTPLQELDLKGDVHYEMQKFFSITEGVPPPPNQNLIGSTFGEAYRRTLPAKIALTQSLSVLPAWNNSNAFSAIGAIGIALPTYKRLTVNLGLTDNYLNNPAPGFQKNSFQFVTGVGYTFQ